MKQAKAKYDIQNAIYGDIDIETHKEWEEKVSNLSGTECPTRFKSQFPAFSSWNLIFCDKIEKMCKFGDGKEENNGT